MFADPGGAAGLPPSGTPGATGPVPSQLLPETAGIGPTGGLTIAGVDVLGLCSEVGTPVFVYDEEHLRRRCREASAAFDGAVVYASKAFLCRAMAQLVASEGLGLDVSTGGELHVALRAGFPPQRLVLHGNNKSELELVTALRADVGRVVVDSFDEIDRLARIAPGLGTRPRVMVRVTPGVEAHTHEFVMTGQEDTKFGFGLASGAADEAVQRLRRRDSGVELVGVHAHIGSQVFALESFRLTMELLAPWFNRTGLEELSIGGGLGVAYVTGETAPTLAEWADTVREAARRSGLDAAVRVTAEPGRAITAAAAVTCYTVGTIKHLDGIGTYISVDGGMSDNPRPVLYGSGYEAFLPRTVGAARPLRAHVVGKHCESGDVVVRNACLPADVAIGDVLATPVTGAYGHSMASTYNKVPRPPVVFVRDGDWRVVVRRETLDELLALDLG